MTARVPAPASRRGAVAAIGVAVFAVLAWTAPLPGRAVLLAHGDGERNVALPPQVPQLGRVLDRDGYGAVYLERGWILTARHVAAGTVRAAGRLFEPQPGSLREIHNADGTRADLLLFRVDPGIEPLLPHLPPLRIAARSPSPGSLVYLMGAGANRGEPLRWSLGVFGERRGWHWGQGRALRWGTNRVAGRGITVPMADYHSRGFSMLFGEPEGGYTTEHEAQVAVGDSGGGVFANEEGQWVLAGILVARSLHPGQPSESAAFGNRTLAVDLSHYRTRILEIIDAPFEPGNRARVAEEPHDGKAGERTPRESRGERAAP